MSWNRAKLILIFLFLLINIFLFNILRNLEAGENKIDNSVIENCVTIARNHKITIKKEIIPSERRKNSQMELSSVASDPAAAAKRFLGDSFTAVSENETEHRFEFEKDGNKLILDQDLIHFKKARKPVGADNSNSADRAVYELRKYGINPRSVKIISSGEQNKIRFITIKPYYKQYEIDPMTLKVFYDNDGIIEISGTWYDIHEFAAGNDYLTDITSAIISLGDLAAPEEIVQIDFSYFVPVDMPGAKYVQAIPVYKFKTSGGEEIIIDARTGENIL